MLIYDDNDDENKCVKLISCALDPKQFDIMETNNFWFI